MIGHLLNSAVTVYRPAYVADGRGGRTETTAAVGTLRAKVDQPSATEQMVAAQMGATLTHVVHVAYEADVRRDDEIDVGEGRRLRVLAVVSDSHRTYKRVECRVIQGE
jgi:SPP1 family predicted phage head-tail adaptor